MKSAKLVAICLATTLLSTASSGRVVDYRLNDQFIIQTSNSKTGETGLEVWDILLIRSLINEKEVDKRVHTQLDLTTISLYPFVKDQYLITGVYRRNYDPEYDNLFFDDGSFSFTLGIDQNFRIKLDFNKDGSLRDITGSTTDLNTPDNVTTFKLVKQKKEFNIKVENKFPSGLYNYKRRF